MRCTPLLAVLCLYAFQTHAQDADTPSSPVDATESAELQRLKERAQIEEQKKLIAEHQSAANKAKYGESDTRGPEDTLSLDADAGYFAELQAYEAMRNAATEIAGAVQCNTDEPVQIVHLSQTTDTTLLSAVSDQIAYITTQATIEATTGAELAAAEGAGTVLLAVAAFADLAGMFRSETAISGEEVTVDDKAVAAELAAALLAKPAPKCKVSIPGLYLGSGTKPKVLNELDGMRRAISDMMRVREEVAELAEVAKKDVADLTKQLEANKKANKPTQQIEKSLADASAKLTARKARLETIDAIATLAKTLSSELIATTDSKPSILERIIAASVVNSTAARRLAYQVSSSGGEHHITKALWMAGRVNYVGGVVITWFLVDSDGSVAATGTTTAWGGKSYKPKEFQGWYTSPAKRTANLASESP